MVAPSEEELSACLVSLAQPTFPAKRLLEHLPLKDALNLRATCPQLRALCDASLASVVVPLGSLEGESRKRYLSSRSSRASRGSRQVDPLRLVSRECPCRDGLKEQLSPRQPQVCGSPCLPVATALPVSILAEVAASLPGVKEITAVAPSPCARGPWWDAVSLALARSQLPPKGVVFGPVFVRLHNRLPAAAASVVVELAGSFSEVWLDLNTKGKSWDDYENPTKKPNDATLAVIDALAPKVTEIGLDDFWANGFTGRDAMPRWQARQLPRRLKRCSLCQLLWRRRLSPSLRRRHLHSTHSQSMEIRKAESPALRQKKAALWAHFHASRFPALRVIELPANVECRPAVAALLEPLAAASAAAAAGGGDTPLKTVRIRCDATGTAPLVVLACPVHPSLCPT